MYVWRSGLVEIGAKTPDDAVCVATGTKKQLESYFVYCRQMKDGSGKYIVNDIPEAKTSLEAEQALDRFHHIICNKIAGKKAFDGMIELKAQHEQEIFENGDL